MCPRARQWTPAAPWPTDVSLWDLLWKTATFAHSCLILQINGAACRNNEKSDTFKCTRNKTKHSILVIYLSIMMRQHGFWLIRLRKKKKKKKRGVETFMKLQLLRWMSSKYGRFPQDLNAPSSTAKYLCKSVFGVMRPQRANQMMDWPSTVIYWSVYLH